MNPREALHAQTILEQLGYEVTLREPIAPWQGYSKPRKHAPILATRDNTTVYVTNVGHHHFDAIDGLREVQDDVQNMARIIDRVEHLILTEYIPDAEQLWQLGRSESRPDVANVERDLLAFATSLSRHGLVHGDIRPWNVLYSQEREAVFVIDWGYVFAVGDVPEDTRNHLRSCNHTKFDSGVDATDVERTIAAIRSPSDAIQLWRIEESDPDTFPPGWN